jgi:hypothetical protein
MGRLPVVERAAPDFLGDCMIRQGDLSGKSPAAPILGARTGVPGRLVREAIPTGRAAPAPSGCASRL